MKAEDSYTLNLSPEQVLAIFRQLSYDDKIKIIKELRSSTFRQRFVDLLANLKTDGLTEDDIFNEVEEVRKSRYEPK
jgi:hypothetical protein